MTRREFMSMSAATVAAGVMPAFAAERKPDEMRAALLHFGFNMWQKGERIDEIEFDEQVWRRLTARMAEKGFNTVLIDLGEALNYPSHPELAVKGGWDPDRFRKELDRLRALGLEPLPKLNFSCGHNAWLGPYRRMVSTRRYYEVVHDLVRDVAEIFGRPRLFHIGYDEEDTGNQRTFKMCIVRQGELWWHDLLDLVGEIEKNGMRAWMWSDYAWHHPDFIKRCPKSVLQCNWYYRQWFDFNDATFPKNRHIHLRTFRDLEEAGFDQVVCGSNWATDENMVPLVKYARGVVAPERLKGFMMATWEATLPKSEEKLSRGIDQLAEGFAKYPA